MIERGDAPLVSVIVCTYNRPTRLRRALDSVYRQDLRDLEVIVVDDGSTTPPVLSCPDGITLRTLRTPHRGAGAARAEGLSAARGALVAYCDDDDEWTPDHLRTLSGYLRQHPEVDLVYGDSDWIQDGKAHGVAYSIEYDSGVLATDNFIFATDVMHRTSAAREVGGFNPALQAHEDWDLWLRLSHSHVLRHLPITLGAHHWHAGCVSAQHHWEDWAHVYESHERRLAEAGPAAQHGLSPERAPLAPFDPATWRDGRRELIWHSVLRANEGYGSMGRQLLWALARQGVAITVAPTRHQPPAGFEPFFAPLDHWGRFALYCDYRVRPTVLRSPRVINCSMWESTLVPPEHIAEINKAAILQCVPCRQNADSFRDSGLRVPIKVLNLGVDATRFPYLVRQHADRFTFGSFGDLAPRKGIDVLIRAFEDEFAATEPVRLLLRASKSAGPWTIRDPRVTLVAGFLDHPALLEFLREMDAFVLPSRGEGFGLCGLEAMATGLPLIATNWGGPADYLDPQDSFPLSYRLVPTRGARSNHVQYFGEWAEPDYEQLRHLMRWLYEHPAEAAAKGRRAAGRVHADWTWDRAGRELRDTIDMLAS